MIVGITTTYAINADHHKRCEFDTNKTKIVCKVALKTPNPNKHFEPNEEL
jgi:hypothetical protein